MELSIRIQNLNFPRDFLKLSLKNFPMECFVENWNFEFRWIVHLFVQNSVGKHVISWVPNLENYFANFQILEQKTLQ